MRASVDRAFAPQLDGPAYAIGVTSAGRQDRRNLTRVLLFCGFLLPIAYIGLLLTTFVHEVFGHGCVALGLGGTFSGWAVFWNGSGYAWSLPAAWSPKWHRIAIHAGGIAATTVVGTMICLLARRRKTESSLGAIFSVIGALMLIRGASYALWGAVDDQGPGDPARILHELSGSDQTHLGVARVIWLATAAVLLLWTGWWGLRILWRHFETQIGNGNPLRISRRVFGLFLLIVAPAAAYTYAASGFELSGPRLGYILVCIDFLALVAVSALVARFPLPTFSHPLTVTRWHLIVAWTALGSLGFVLQPFWDERGVVCGSPPQTCTSEAVVLAFELDHGPDLEEVTRLDRLAEDLLISIPKDKDSAHLMVSLGSAWRRVGKADRALECFERLGREWGREVAITALMLEVGVLTGDLHDHDAAVTRVEQFIAVANGDDRNAALRVLAMLEVERGDCVQALKAWMAWTPPSGDDRSAERADAMVQIARCRFAVGEVAIALSLLESRLADAKELWSPALVLDYAEYAGRSGRIEQARSFVNQLPGELRNRCTPYVEFVSAWLAKDTSGAMAFIANGDVELLLLDRFTRLIVELGQPATDLIASRVADGDRIAIQMAGHSGLPELLVPLESRRAIGGPDQDSVISAITRLRAETSRPSSRNAK